MGTYALHLLAFAVCTPFKSASHTHFRAAQDTLFTPDLYIYFVCLFQIKAHKLGIHFLIAPFPPLLCTKGWARPIPTFSHTLPS